MCKSPLHPHLAALPKCEHHLHIEGTLEPDLLFSLAKKNGVSLPPPEDDPNFATIDTLAARYKRFTSLDDFLHYYFVGMRTLITSTDFEDLAYAYFTKAHRDGVVHAEIFFDPQEHIRRGVGYETVLSGLQKACDRAKTDFSTTSELIPCLLRHFSADECHDVYLDTFFPSLQKGEVKGLGLSSTEKERPPSLYSKTFRHAKENGLLTTAHAGEEGPVSYMSEALASLRVNRVDHGIKLPHDPSVMAEYASSKTMVTLCPISNLVLHCVDEISELPIRTYLDNGVRFSINSDDPAYFGGYILDNYCAVQDAFDLSVEDWSKICVHAIEGSWCSEGRKDEMLKSLADVLGKYAEQ